MLKPWRAVCNILTELVNNSRPTEHEASALTVEHRGTDSVKKIEIKLFGGSDSVPYTNLMQALSSFQT